jgi:FkbM family methyltransferase
VADRIGRHPSNRGHVPSQLLRACLWQAWKRLTGKPWTVRLANGLRFRVPPESWVGSLAIYFRDPYFPAGRFIRRFLQGGLVLDVGANVGLFTLSLADRVERAVLFEPDPDAAREAVSNLRLNGKRYQVIQAALSDAGGEVVLLRGRPMDPTGTVAGDAQDSRGGVRVPCLTLDDVLGRPEYKDAAIDLLKIDVEGHEVRVLRGASETLALRRPRLVMFEALDGVDPLPAVEILSRAGYRVGRLGAADRLVPWEGAERDSDDLFAVQAGMPGVFVGEASGR